MNKGDICIVKFPFTDQSDMKIRPALVLADPLGENTIYLQITSKKSSFERYEVEINNKELNSKSYVRVDCIANLNKSLHITTIGNVGVDVLKEVDEKMKMLLRL